MVTTPTRIHKGKKFGPFLREHRKAQGISASIVAGRLGIERESVLRLERKPKRVATETVEAYADAIGVDARDLYLPPGRPSLDAIADSAPDDMIVDLADIARRMVRRAG